MVRFGGDFGFTVTSCWLFVLYLVRICLNLLFVLITCVCGYVLGCAYSLSCGLVDLSCGLLLVCGIVVRLVFCWVVLVLFV